MRIKFILIVFFTVNLFYSCRTSQQIVDNHESRVSPEELVELFDIKKFVLPAPKNNLNLTWKITLRDFKEYKEIIEGEDNWMDLSKNTNIYFMPTDRNSIYKFWIKMPDRESSGIARLDACYNSIETIDKPADNIEKPCTCGQLTTKWYKKPIRIDDGQTFIICELNGMFGEGRKQVILELVQFRL